MKVSKNNVSATRRNALCPCGSGKKYKHCCMKEAKGIIPKQEEDYFSEAMKLKAKGKHSQALKLLDRMIYFKDKFGAFEIEKGYLEKIAILKECKLWDEAIKSAEALLQYDIEYKKSQFREENTRLLAELFILSGQGKKGLALFEKLIGEDSTNLYNYLSVASVLLEKGEKEKAREYLRRGLKSRSTDPEKLHLLLERILARIE